MVYVFQIWASCLRTVVVLLTISAVGSYPHENYNRFLNKRANPNARMQPRRDLGGMMPNAKGDVRKVMPPMGNGEQMGAGAKGHKKPQGHAPPKQPKVQYEKVMYREEFDVSYRWTENNRVHFTCPRGSYISKLSYNFGTGSSPVKPLGLGPSLSDILTLKDKLQFGLKEDKSYITFLRHTSGKSIDSNSELLKNIDGLQKSLLTRTGCDPIMFCLGHQTCLFKLTVDICANDPAPGKRKALNIKVTCSKDSTLVNYAKDTKEFEVLRKKADEVMYIVYDQNASWETTSVLEFIISSEEEIFQSECPSPKEAIDFGYSGWCKASAPSQLTMANDVWDIIGRVSQPECRVELKDTYCAFHMNGTGGCIPPAFTKKSLDGRRLAPGQIQFSYKALPEMGTRPDLTEFKKVLQDSHSGLIPAKFGFLLLVHTCPECILQLLRLIYRPYFVYVIHVDQRRDEIRSELNEKMDSITNGYDNIHVLPKERSFVASWGSYDIVRAELEGFEELMRMGAFDFVINLSGADLPIRDVDDLAAMFSTSRGFNFMRINGNWNDRSQKTTDTSVWYGCGAHVYNISSRSGKAPWSDMHSTSQWAVFSRDYLEMVLNPSERTVYMNALQLYTQTSIIPDESYFMSMLKVSPFKKKFVHMNLHHLKQFARKDDRGFCRHTEDIDFCGQGPGTFEESDNEAIQDLANNLFFARKFSSKANDPARVFAGRLTNGLYYSNIQSKQGISDSFIRQLAELALSEHYGQNWEDTIMLESIVKVRMFPQVIPLDPCCKPIYGTKNQLNKEIKYWIDFSAVEVVGGQRKFFRASLLPQSRTQCYSRGHLKGLHITTIPLNKKRKTQVQAMNVVPTEQEGATTLFLRSYFNLNDKFPEAPQCNEIENLPDESFEGRNPDSFTFARYSSKSPSKESLEFNATLIDPEGEVRCLVHVIITWNTPGPFVQVSDTVRYVNTLNNCGALEAGLWTVALFQRDVKEPFPYTTQVFLSKQGSKNWLDFKRSSDDLNGLWFTEDIKELSNDELQIQSKWSPTTPFDTELEKINEDIKNIQRPGDRNGYENKIRQRINMGHVRGAGRADTQESHAEMEAEEGEMKNVAVADNKNNTPEKGNRYAAIGSSVGNRPRKEEFNNQKEDMGNEPIDRHIRRVEGWNDRIERHINKYESLNSKDSDNLIGGSPNIFTLLQFLLVSTVVFIFVKSVLVPLRIVKRRGNGMKSFVTFLVIFSALQFVVYITFLPTKREHQGSF
ncbi:uncharacterized protein [Antedon mediterranea]|uniref:uncharacterized protein isoform X2 n=1 Tax=Antedon mediterranea TaxID=105859 RepID=UPI003AF74A92